MLSLNIFVLYTLYDGYMYLILIIVVQGVLVEYRSQTIHQCSIEDSSISSCSGIGFGELTRSPSPHQFTRNAHTGILDTYQPAYHYSRHYHHQ